MTHAKGNDNNDSQRVAILYPGDAEARRSATPEKSRFLKVFQALEALGLKAEPAVYHDDFCDEVRAQLLRVQAVLVWVNPIEGNHDRTVLDAMLREVAASDVFVSTHPEVILKLGTKAVLFRTRDVGWGSDTQWYASLDDLRQALPPKLARGEARVLKQLRGQSGDGVWKVELANAAGHPSAPCTGDSPVRARHAKRGCVEETLTLDAFYARCAPYFTAGEGQGGMIDQAWQTRLPEGMIRCYLVHGTVQGFGHQAINALYPAPAGAPPEAAPLPSPRLYHPPTVPAFQALKRQLETQWLPEAQRLLNIADADLPALWDCDFMFGPKTAAGDDTYVLCEINVSCVSPFPDSAVAPLARAVLARLSMVVRPINSSTLAN